MSDESPLLKRLTENSTEVPVVTGGRDTHTHYALLLVLLCVFAGGTLLLLTILLIFCHRCCPGGRRYSRASDDLEKTNTTYVEETQPSQDITIRLEGVDGLSAPGCHDDVEAEGFLSAVSTGRRVSFNEQAIYEQSKRGQEKGRRYTLTEGDFHHLKRARLTHLHISPPALNILTIMESSENSIQQPMEEGISWSPQSPSGGLPGDTLNSVLDTSFTESLPSEAMCERGWTMAGARAEAEPEVSRSSSGATVSTGQGFTKMILSKLRRHTSLEGASPYLRMKRWRLDRSQRAASLDMRGSPKRRAFQRQRAASETLDHEEAESHTVGGDFLCSLAPPLFPEPASSPRRLSAGSLPSPVLGRLEVEAVMELSSGVEPDLTPDLPVTLAMRSHPMGEENGLDVEEEELEEEEEQEEEEEEEEGAVGVSGGGAGGGGAGGGGRGWGGPGALLRRRTDGGADGGGGGEAAEPTPYRDIWSLRASLEQYASSDLSSNDRDSTRSDADSLSSLGGAGKPGGSAAVGAAGAGAGATAMMFQSQDIDEELPYDEPPATTKVREEEEEEAQEEEEEEDHRERRRRGGRGGGGGDSVDSERGGSDGESAGRKLLQMDSGYASMDAPPLAGGVGGGGGKTASERRRYFTCAGRKGTVCESFEARLLQEESDETELEVESEENHAEVAPEKQLLVAAAPVAVIPKEPRSSPIVKSPLAQKPRLFRRRDYSIDERTEALFNEFLRHDPRLDPRPHHHHHSRSARSSRLHLRTQWQRAKQHSDPGGSTSAATARLSPSLERLRWGPLRRGESAGYPLDASTPTATTRYHLHHHHHHHLHGPLPRIASAADEENSEGAEEGTEEPKTASGSMEEQEKVEGEVEEEKVEGEVEQEKVEGEVEQEKVEDNCSNNNSSSSSSCGAIQTSGLHPEQRGEERGDVGGLSVLLTPDLEHCGTLEDPGSLAADKIAANLEERLYGGLRRTHHVQEQTVVVVAHTSPDDTAE